MARVFSTIANKMEIDDFCIFVQPWLQRCMMNVMRYQFPYISLYDNDRRRDITFEQHSYQRGDRRQFTLKSPAFNTLR